MGVGVLGACCFCTSLFVYSLGVIGRRYSSSLLLFLFVSCIPYFCFGCLKKVVIFDYSLFRATSFIL